MKKLMCAAAALIAGIAVADVTSANIVGYANQDSAGKYTITGFCFGGISQNGKVNLSNLAAIGWDWENDYLQIINPQTCGNAKKLVWLTKEIAQEGGVGDLAGWYDADEFTYESDGEFDLGSGFLTSLFSKNIKFNYLGEVFDQAFSLPCVGKYNTIPNALPKTIKLEELTVTSWDWENDYLQILNPDTCGNLKKLVWLSKEVAVEGGVGEKAGWYDADEFTYEGSNIELKPGEGMLTSLFSTGVKFNFPSAISGANK